MERDKGRALINQKRFLDKLISTYGITKTDASFLINPDANGHSGYCICLVTKTEPQTRQDVRNYLLRSRSDISTN